jgi:hypothetical protein
VLLYRYLEPTHNPFREAAPDTSVFQFFGVIYAWSKIVVEQKKRGKKKVYYGGYRVG